MQNNRQKQIIDIASPLIKQYEGLKLKAYKCSAGVWTIGYGNTSYLGKIQSNQPCNQTISQVKAEQLFKQDLQRFFDGVYQEIGSICNNYQIAACISLAYNIGLDAFKKSTVLKKIKTKAPREDVIEWFLKWNKINGEESKGLTNRRVKEITLFYS
jgi:lysozyme